jgi:UDP-2,3-diacylglucosamine hydrolase
LEELKLNPGRKIYFASDFHLGAPTAELSRIRELKIIDWLNHIEKDAHTIFLVGDLFDFWFEYKQVIPKGFVRLQGKIAALADRGIKIYFFLGNHDMWMKNYFTEELGVEMISNELELKINGKRFFIAHGDGLGPGDYGYKFIKKVFRNKFCQFLFSFLHPRIGLSMAQYFSNKSRIHTGTKDINYTNKEDEWLYQYCKSKHAKAPIDYFIFGHRHLPMEIAVSASKYLNLGEWMNFSTYAEFDGSILSLKVWSEDGEKAFEGIKE